MAPVPAFLERSRTASERVSRLGTVFVLGCQKSGTTWLQQLFNVHPAIVLSGEGHFTSVLAPVLAKAFETHNAQAKAVFKLDDGDLFACLRCAIDRTLSRYIDDRVTLGADPNAIRWVGDKTPEAAVAIPLLETLYPGSRYIHIIRDGRDGVVSGWAHLTREKSQTRFPSVTEYAEYFAKGHWLSYISLARQAGAKLGSRYTEVRYEAIHRSPHTEVERLLRFLDVDASSEAVDACVNAGDFKRLTKGRERGDADPNSQFRKGIVGDFAQSLPIEAIARFESIAGGLLKELGYPLVASGASVA